MLNFSSLLIIQLALTFFLNGIIWFLQVVHYPLYYKIKEGFHTYEKNYLKKAVFLMSPIMFLELISAILLISDAETAIFVQLASANLIFLIINWLSTFILQNTEHQKLAVRFSVTSLHRLISTNWIRTFFWTVRGIILLIMAFLYF
ncbi:hypothetical protein COB21_04595 [Candidatus Aerophobetes bacterium]|uniref:DUF1772 domain-containing protein n=1 Tax=Aerophobetes bacterium TaxID=2030807 RepID=A0A2A4X1A6_UNCAE|nr:MAG: hypothetical protein COB21_04595 [Candidatus Aerophobetes bacterium]